MDSKSQVEVRSKINGIDEQNNKDLVNLIEKIQNILMKENILIKQFRTCYEQK